MHSELLLVSTTLAFRMYIIMNGVNIVWNIFSSFLIPLPLLFLSSSSKDLNLLLRDKTRTAYLLLSKVVTLHLSGCGIWNKKEKCKLWMTKGSEEQYSRNKLWLGFILFILFLLLSMCTSQSLMLHSSLLLLSHSLFHYYPFTSTASSIINRTVQKNRSLKQRTKEKQMKKKHF